MTLAYNAMMFARDVHKDQVRRYTNNPYVDHLAEVAGIALTAGWHNATIHPDKLIATAWLHDCVEDQDVQVEQIEKLFGLEVAMGVAYLSDIEVGTRVERKAAARDRLSRAPSWVQTIKVADLISNTSSIVKHDPKFAVTYLEEKRLMLHVLERVDLQLLQFARRQVAAYQLGLPA